MPKSQIRKQLDRIQKDIATVLKKTGVPMTQHELHTQTELKNISVLGWSFALSDMYKAGLVQMDDQNKWSFTKKGKERYA
jgi:hypothetical protein